MNKRKISFSLVIGNWNLEITDDAEKLLVNNKKCGGAIRYKERTIYIDVELDTFDFDKVLLHELTHAILYETQIDLKEYYTEEDLCEFMAKYSEIIHNKFEEIKEEL